MEEETVVMNGNVAEKPESRGGDGDKVMKGGCQVACTECGGWYSLKEVGIAGLHKSEIDEMDVFCMKCMHLQQSRMRRQLNECMERMKYMEETINNLIHSKKGDRVEEGSTESNTGRKTNKKRKQQKRTRNLDTPASENEDSVGDDSNTPAAEEAASPESTTNSCVSNVSGGEETTEVENDHSARVNTNEPEFEVVNRRHKRKKLNIKIIGDSMVKNISKIVRCEKEGSSVFYKRGAGIKEIVEKTKEECANAKDGSLIVIQGGGNSLKYIGIEETVAAVVNCVQEIRTNRKDLNIAVTSILPRPREKRDYESWRKRENNEIQKNVCLMGANSIKNKEDDHISFLDMDCVLDPTMFGQDEVHLNHEGELCLGRRILTWIKGKERSHLSHSHGA